MKTLLNLLVLVLFLLHGCGDIAKETSADTISLQNYLDFSERDDQFTGGIKMIPISTPKGDFKVWTKRVGNNPTMKLLLLHGGPGATHEVFDCFDGYFYLLGQSWGGILAMEYAFKHQDKLKGLIISNMMSNVPEYNNYAQEVLCPQMDPEVLQELKEMEARNDFGNPRYMEVLMEHYYTKHLLRMPVEKWPQSVNLSFRHMNQEVYVYMQGPSEFGIAGDATLKYWDVSKELPGITVPTLVIGATYDTMDPEHMEWMSEQLPRGRFLLCPNGSHLSQYDDQKNYMGGLVKFMNDVDQGDF